MAWGHAHLTTPETTNLALDKPILGTQAIPVAPTSAIWTESGAVGATDRTLSTNPARRAYDGFCGLWTCPDATASATWYYTMELASAGVEFDFVAFLGNNFGTITVSALTLEIADTSDFSGGTYASIPIASTITVNTRIMQLDLTHEAGTASRYSSVKYARFKWTGCDAKPQFGEVILGRRRQLNHRPRLPHDATSLHSTSEAVETMGGVLSKAVYAAGRRRLSADFREWTTTPIADLIAWFKETNYGTRPFVWIGNPLTAPNSWHYMVLDETDFDFPTEEFADRNLTIEATEQGPENYYLDRGVY